MRVRMELFAKIRRDARVEGVSIRGLAKRYQIGRDTVRQALSDPLSPARKTPVRSSPRLDPFKPAIEAMLTEDTTAPRKQRHTARRILARLVEEHGAEQLSYSTLRDYVRVRCPQMWSSAIFGRGACTCPCRSTSWAPWPLPGWGYSPLDGIGGFDHRC
jgi:hypothetical protein